MTTFANMREASKANFGCSESGANFEQINAGSLQRLADAAEKMAVRHTDLIRERDNYERWYHEERAAVQRLTRQLTALRGVITKLKNKEKQA